LGTGYWLLGAGYLFLVSGRWSVNAVKFIARDIQKFRLNLNRISNIEQGISNDEGRSFCQLCKKH